MDISRLNSIINSIRMSGKVQKVGQTQESSVEGNVEANPEVQPLTEDTVSLTIEGVIKTAAMQMKQESESIQEDKVNALKAHIQSGQYQVDPQDVARAILKGRSIYEELK
jgi:flagellar biosynthesis anti-sigma factor FlgM